MKKIKNWEMFLEDGVGSANASIGGMGAVSNATIGTLPGVGGKSGSDISFYLTGGGKRKKGNPSEVTDLRDLEDVDVEEVDDLKLDESNTDDRGRALEKFKKDFGTELDPGFTISEIGLLRKCFSRFHKDFLKNRIKSIEIGKDLDGVHGKWKSDGKDGVMLLNPSIFEFKKEMGDGLHDVPYKEFVIIHEIGHCIDHIEKISFSKKWQAISGWKRCPIDTKIPEGYVRYIEKRPGREKAGHKKSNWISKDGSDFCRKYSSRNPREDFADSFAFAVFAIDNKFKGDGGKRKLEIINNLLKKIEN